MINIGAGRARTVCLIVDVRGCTKFFCKDPYKTHHHPRTYPYKRICRNLRASERAYASTRHCVYLSQPGATLLHFLHWALLHPLLRKTSVHGWFAGIPLHSLSLRPSPPSSPLPPTRPSSGVGGAAGHIAVTILCLCDTAHPLSGFTSCPSVASVAVCVPNIR
jgi:hypothetical protein